MISKSQKNKIIKVLGNHYSSLVMDYLNAHSIRNKHGKPYTDAAIIRNVMGGQSHAEIEKAIFAVVEIELQKKKEESEKRKQILLSAS